jgi:hypothetical protein
MGASRRPEDQYAGAAQVNSQVAATGMNIA